MRNFIKSATITLFLLPNTAFAVTECNYVEFPDHFEAVCSGDEKPLPAPVAKRASVVDRTTTQPAVSEDRDVAVQDHPTGAVAAKGRATNPNFSSRGKRITREIVDAKQAIRMQNIQMKKFENPYEVHDHDRPVE